MEFGQFQKGMILAAIKMPKYALNFHDPIVARGWYEELKDIDGNKFGAAIAQCIKTQNEFPSIAQLFRLCGKEFLTVDQKADKIADKILAAVTCGGRSREELGDCAFDISMNIGGYSLLSSLNLLDASVYNTQRRRLAGLAKDWMERKRIRDEMQLNTANQETTSAPRIGHPGDQNQPEHKGCPPTATFKGLMASIRLGKMA